MEGKVAALGSPDFVMPFSALGLDTFGVGDDKAEMNTVAKKIIDAKYALVVVAENVAPAVEETFSAVQGAPTPCITVVPFTTESKGFATKTLGAALKMATGINMLEENSTQ